MKTFKLLLPLLTLALFAFAAPEKAKAAFDAIDETIVMDSGTSTATKTITLSRTQIKDMVLWCPTLDSGDTATLSLVVNAFDSTYSPVGWSTVAIGSTADNAIVKCASAALAINVDGTITITIQTSTNQAAARTFKLRIYREY